MAAEKPVMIVGIDESEHSFYALNWTIDHFFAPYAPNHPFNLILVHAKPLATSAVGFAGPGISSLSLSLSFCFRSITLASVCLSRDDDFVGVDD